jgi:phospholipid/cholesterol/gamma-HCH transport system substrate-binding protein
MATRKEKVNAGLFLLIGVLLISLTIAVVAGLNLRQPGVPYTIRISKSVGGLREGSVVRYLGVPVGRVTDVDFPKSGGEVVLVAIEITKASTPIRAGTYATLASNFLTGETSIELLGGSDDGARLLPESIINWRPTTLMRLEDSLPGVLDELKKVVVDVHELFGSYNQTRIAKLIDDVDAAVLELHARIEPMARDVQDVKERLALSSESIADSAAGLRRDVTASVDSGVTSLKAASKSIEGVTAKLSTVGDHLIEGTAGIEELVKSLRAAAARLDDALGGTDALVGDNRDELRRTIAALRQSSRELAALLAELKRDPSELIFSDKEPERTREAVADKPVRHGGGP